MTSSCEFILEFIDKFKLSRCLWQVGHNDYRSKNKRVAALEELLTLYRTRDPDATRHTVQTKINSLRGAFKKELNKVRASQMRGDDKVHVPKLWYYDKMLFLEEQMFQKPPSSPSSSLLVDTITYEECQESYDDINYVTSPVGSPESQVSDGPYEIKNSESYNTDALSKPSKRKNFESFGEHVAEQLRDMPEKSQKICIKIISDALFLAGMGNLDVSSRIVTDPLDFTSLK